MTARTMQRLNRDRAIAGIAAGIRSLPLYRDRLTETRRAAIALDLSADEMHGWYLACGITDLDEHARAAASRRN